MNKVPHKIGTYDPKSVKKVDLKKVLNHDTDIIDDLLNAIRKDSMALLPDWFCGGRSKDDEKLFVLYRSK